MDPFSAVLAFSLAAALLTLTPGLDTALVLRIAAVEGPRPATLAGLGINAGVLVWGVLASVGLGALLTVSQVAFSVLQAAGALYLFWLGLSMLRSAWRPRPAELAAAAAPPAGGWFWRGLMTNLLNPKVGVFYVSFLPQFVPDGVQPVLFSAGLAGIHAAMGVVWFAALTLATRPIAGFLRRPAVTRTLDGVTGLVLIGFGLRLLAERRA